MSIRWKLTLWFALIMCVILVFTGIVLETLLELNLYDQVNDNLRAYLARVNETLEPDEIPDPLDYDVVYSKLPAVNEFASPSTYIQLLDEDGNMVVKSDNLGEQELPVNPSLIEEGFAGNILIGTVVASDNARVRILVSPLHIRDHTLLLEVGQSLENVDSILSQLKWAIRVGVLLAIILAVVSGGILVRRALAPVKRITATARSIEESSDLSRRVNYKGTPDEIGQLAKTFDHMIERLDDAFQSQKAFIADASHELRGPLTVFKGNLDLLKRNLSEEDRQEALRDMGAQTERMAKIVEDLLFLAEIESGREGQQEIVSLKEILEEGLNRGQQLAGNRKITIGREEDLTVKGDAHRLRQLFANLINNAIRYTPEEGNITLSLYREGDYACLEVSDTGIGIEPEHLEHIFDRFYRTDKARSRAKGGVGLGLAIVKGIAEQHRGKVTVTSKPGKGSTFTAWLKL